MAVLAVHHRVKDFKAWKTVFDEHGPRRAAAGCQGGRMFRPSDDSNDVHLLFDWDSLESARQFAASDDLRAAMSRAGVIGQPDVAFLDEVENFSR